MMLMGLCPKPRGLLHKINKKGNKKNRSIRYIKSLLPFLHNRYLLILVAPQRCHSHSVTYLLYIILEVNTIEK